MSTGFCLGLHIFDHYQDGSLFHLFIVHSALLLVNHLLIFFVHFCIELFVLHSFISISYLNILALILCQLCVSFYSPCLVFSMYLWLSVQKKKNVFDEIKFSNVFLHSLVFSMLRRLFCS